MRAGFDPPVSPLPLVRVRAAICTLEDGEAASRKPFRSNLIIIYLAWVHNSYNNEFHRGTSLVAQWLRIRLPMQGTRVQPLVREDPTCRGATKLVRHNY